VPSLPATQPAPDQEHGRSDRDAGEVEHDVPQLARASREQEVLDELAHRGVDREDEDSGPDGPHGAPHGIRRHGEDEQVDDLVGPAHRALDSDGGPVEDEQLHDDGSGGQDDLEARAGCGRSRKPRHGTAV